MAQTHADRGRRGPRGAKLATNLRLRREVQARLGRHDSPEQIAGRLKIDFPDEPEMWVSAETIYQSLYIQARGGLKRELTTLSAHGPFDAETTPDAGPSAYPNPGDGDDQRAAS